jgi:calcium-dependent protein kinase
MSSEEE